MVPVVGDDIHSPETLVSPDAEHQGLSCLKLAEGICVFVFVNADDFAHLQTFMITHLETFFVWHLVLRLTTQAR